MFSDERRDPYQRAYEYCKLLYERNKANFEKTPGRKISVRALMCVSESANFPQEDFQVIQRLVAQ
eukprot:341097-Amorphochlora_amoeboformis.AAC.2